MDGLWYSAASVIEPAVVGTVPVQSLMTRTVCLHACLYQLCVTILAGVASSVFA